MDDAEDKSIGFDYLVDDPEFVCNDLTVFEMRGIRKLRRNMSAFRMLGKA
jgi:hypothetical protein